MLLDVEFKKPDQIVLSYINESGYSEIFKTNVPKDQMFEWRVDAAGNKRCSKEYENWDGKKVFKERTLDLSRNRIFQYLYDFHKDFMDNIVFNSKNFPKVLYFDIEVLTDDDGFPKPELALKPIITISFCVDDFVTVYYWDEQKRCVDKKEIEIKINEHIKKNNPGIKREFKINIVKFDNEKELLFNSVKNFFNVYPVWSGWNIRNFDYTYIKNRLSVLGIDKNIISNGFGFRDKSDEPKHFVLLDYYELFLKYDRSVKVRENFTLDFISKSVTGIHKIRYNGTLDNLLKNDLFNFILYNSIDSVLVSLINDKLKIINVYNFLCNFSRIEAYLGINSSLAIEKKMFDTFYGRKKVCVNKYNKNKNEKYEGAYVYANVNSINDFVIGCDYTSMYPTIMMQWNIGPDTFITKLNEVEKELVLNKDFTPLKNFGIKNEKEITITSSGAVFNKKNKSVVAELVEHLFNKRKQVKKEYADIEIVIKGLKDYIHDRNKDSVIKMKEILKTKNILKNDILNKNILNNEEFIDEKHIKYEIDNLNNLLDIYSIEENAYKIYINAIYGVMGFSKFYFFNKDVAEAVTLQGQSINKTTINSINFYFKDYFWKDKKLHSLLNITSLQKPENINDAVIYGDTDSTYVSFENIMFLRPQNMDDVDFIRTVWDNSLQPFLIKVQEKFSEKYFTKSKLELKFEKILRRMIIFAKKKYVTDLLWKTPDIRYEPLQKMDFVGVEVVKSDLPNYIRKKIMDFLKNMILYGKDYKKEDIIDFYNKTKKEFFQQSPDVISMAKKISDYQKYVINDSEKIEINKKCPLHIKSGATYNYIIRKYKLTKKYRFINSGDKINFFYIKNMNGEFVFNSEINVFGFLPNEFPMEISNIIKIDYESQFKVVFEDVIKRYVSEIYNIKNFSLSNDLCELF
jgi:DNA polymerase elongation subunit (family B)